jgi:hypothetical protein
MLSDHSTTSRLSPLQVVISVLPSPPPSVTFNFFRRLHLDFTFGFHQMMKGCQIAFLTVIYWCPQFSGVACHLLLLYLIPDRIEFLGKPFRLQMEGANVLSIDAWSAGISLERAFCLIIQGKTCSPVGGSSGRTGSFRVSKGRLRRGNLIDQVKIGILADERYLELCSRRKTDSWIK